MPSLRKLLGWTLRGRPGSADSGPARRRADEGRLEETLQLPPGLRKLPEDSPAAHSEGFTALRGAKGEKLVGVLRHPGMAAVAAVGEIGTGFELLTASRGRLDRQGREGIGESAAAAGPGGFGRVGPCVGKRRNNSVCCRGGGRLSCSPPSRSVHWARSGTLLVLGGTIAAGVAAPGVPEFFIPVEHPPTLRFGLAPHSIL
jgi:hypothetical protein